MHICTLTAITTAPAKAAWDLLSEPKLWHTWDHDLKQAQLISAFQQGSQGYLIRKDGSTTTFSVLACKPMVSYVVTISLQHQAALVITRSMHQTEEGTMLVQRTALAGSPVGQLKYTSQLRSIKNAAAQQFENILVMLQHKPFVVSDHRPEAVVSPRP